MIFCYLPLDFRKEAAAVSYKAVHAVLFFEIYLVFLLVVERLSFSFAILITFELSANCKIDSFLETLTSPPLLSNFVRHMFSHVAC